MDAVNVKNIPCQANLFKNFNFLSSTFKTIHKTLFIHLLSWFNWKLYGNKGERYCSKRLIYPEKLILIEASSNETQVWSVKKVIYFPKTSLLEIVFFHFFDLKLYFNNVLSHK